MATTTGSQQSEHAKQYDVIGTRPIRHDGLDKVIGAAKFGADTQLSGMLHGKVLRSPYAHALIRGIDTSKAEALPGVTAVVTSKDFPIIKNVFTSINGFSCWPASSVMGSRHLQIPSIVITDLDRTPNTYVSSKAFTR